jgi:hypothetical protein
MTFINVPFFSVCGFITSFQPEMLGSQISGLATVFIIANPLQNMISWHVFCNPGCVL